MSFSNSTILFYTSDDALGLVPSSILSQISGYAD
jgi:hypothetical protein